MIDVRPMTQRDLGDIVAIHRAAFPNFFLSFLGPRFLRVFYGFIASEGIAIVALADGKLAGFVAGVLEPRQFYRRLMRRRFAPLVFAITPIVLRHPSTLARVVRRARQRMSGAPEERRPDPTGKPEERRPDPVGNHVENRGDRRPDPIGDRRSGPIGNHEPNGAELMSLAVDPGHEHRGVGRALVAAFAVRVAASGEGRLWLTTDAADNDRVIHFYDSLGFSRSREFVTAEGRAMVELTRDAELQS
jgi:ribosomal protein S18 acetylase RimI-like enzyme